MDEHSYFNLQCILWNRYSLSILHYNFREYLKTRRTFNVHHKIISILYWWCSICRIRFIILFNTNIFSEDIVCRRPLHLWVTVFPWLLFYSNKISRPSFGKFSHIYCCIPMYSRLRILDLCRWNYFKWLNNGSLPLYLNACLNSTEYDYTTNTFKRHGGEWSFYDAWFHTDYWVCPICIYSKGNKASVTIRKEGVILS